MCARRCSSPRAAGLVTRTSPPTWPRCSRHWARRQTSTIAWAWRHRGGYCAGTAPTASLLPLGEARPDSFEPYGVNLLGAWATDRNAALRHHHGQILCVVSRRQEPGGDAACAAIGGWPDPPPVAEMAAGGEPVLDTRQPSPPPTHIAGFNHHA